MWVLLLLLASRSVFEVHPCCSTYQYFISPCSWIIRHCVNAPHFICPFLRWKAWDSSLVWTIKSDTAVDTCVWVFALYSASIVYIPLSVCSWDCIKICSLPWNSYNSNLSFSDHLPGYEFFSSCMHTIYLWEAQ